MIGSPSSVAIRGRKKWCDKSEQCYLWGVAYCFDDHMRCALNVTILARPQSSLRNIKMFLWRIIRNGKIKAQPIITDRVPSKNRLRPDLFQLRVWMKIKVAFDGMAALTFE